MPTAQLNRGQSVRLEGIRWPTYEAMLRDIRDRRIRLTYDAGSLEIMSPSFRHERYGEMFAKLLTEVVVGLDIPACSGGMTTFKKEDLQKGLEPDRCYWVRNEAKMRGKLEFDPEQDPPPDLALEIDVTRSSLDRLAIYEALGVGEVWRFDGTTLTVYQLRRGRLVEATGSRVFPFLPMKRVAQLVGECEGRSETELVQEYREWVQAELKPHYGMTRRRPRK